ncbi:vacuolar protein 8 [Histoplasma mississippiense (nom. inval.)]|uniref:vacuolar protein 8 n=1 Tax=Ajellomyces capsulatus (strain NAm1 / WU24) TaxID=2059318 RepID=UPI000157BCE8|nr:vacuolar protein 8 [Histoplasma mississippiense (nom. inval.)]EDN05907.1 vacuolar protein 8 [Histoplasma mississippiense (nom. inval.)]
MIQQHRQAGKLYAIWCSPSFLATDADTDTDADTHPKLSDYLCYCPHSPFISLPPALPPHTLSLLPSCCLRYPTPITRLSCLPPTASSSGSRAPSQSIPSHKDLEVQGLPQSSKACRPLVSYQPTQLLLSSRLRSVLLSSIQSRGSDIIEANKSYRGYSSPRRLQAAPLSGQSSPEDPSGLLGTGPSWCRISYLLAPIKGRSRDGLYEPILADNEREAVADLLQYLENRNETDFFSGEPLSALSTLVYSDNVDLQRSASLTFAEITERDVREVNRETLEPILFLLQSPDIEVQRAASAALGNLAVNTENKVNIVLLGGLAPLIRQMMSPNVEVQCNAVGCITNLATHEDNKAKIARSGALGPLTRLAKSKDMRVQRNATGALLNMTHSDENRQQLVIAGAIPVLVQLLSSSDVDVQYYCTTALSNIAVDSDNRKKLAQTESRLVQSLVQLMDSSTPKVQCQAALALRNLASDEKYQLEIVRAVQKCKELVLKVPMSVQSEMTAAIAVLALSDELKSHLLKLGVFDVLIPLTDSESIEVQGNSAAALGNLSSKVGDYSIFVRDWSEPNGGIHGYLSRFLASGDPTFQHIAIWTLLQLLESEDKRLQGYITRSEDIVDMVKAIADKNVESDDEEGGEDDEGEVVALARRSLELLGQGPKQILVEG